MTSGIILRFVGIEKFFWARGCCSKILAGRGESHVTVVGCGLLRMDVWDFRLRLGRILLIEIIKEFAVRGHGDSFCAILGGGVLWSLLLVYQSCQDWRGVSIDANCAGYFSRLGEDSLFLLCSFTLTIQMPSDTDNVMLIYFLICSCKVNNNFHDVSRGESFVLLFCSNYTLLVHINIVGLCWSDGEISGK